MRKEMVKKITGILHEGKIILDLYEKLGCPTDGKKYNEFIFELTKMFAEDTFKYHEMKGTIEWFFTQEGNNLAKTSSGSIHTALSEWDNFISGIEGGIDELSEDENNFAFEVYKGLFW